MKLKMQIGAKMLLFVMVTSVSIMLVIGLFIGFRINKIAHDNAVQLAQAEAQKTANQIKSELELDMGFSRALADALCIYPKFDTVVLDSIFFNILDNQVINNPRYLTVWYSVEYFAFRKGYTKDYGRRSTTAYLKNGIPSRDVEQKNVAGDITTSNYYASKTCNREMLLDPYNFEYGGTEVLATSLSVPIRVNGKFAGLGGVDISLEKFQEQIEKIKPYNNTVVALISNDGTIIAHTNPEYSRLKFGEVNPTDDNLYKISERIKNGSDYKYFSEVNKEQNLNIISTIKVGESPTTWSILLSIPMSEIIVEARRSVLYLIFVFILGVILQGAAIWYISKYITRPIKKATDAINSISEGDINVNKKIFVHTGDELEEMARSANRLIDGLNRTEKFAREIGMGKLDAKFDLLGDKDILGKALLEMQKSLISAKDAEQKRKEEEKQQIWATQGIAMFGEVLRQHNDNLDELSYLIIKNLVTYTNSIQGGVFILNDNDLENPMLDMSACYAYDRRKFMEKSIMPNEGLVGRCFIEGKTIFMKEVPKNYIKITSGLGEENPRNLIIVPLKVNDDILGVIEMATFNTYEKYQIEFIEKIATSIASTLSSVRINIRTAELLTRTQQQAEEMKAQEEEMRQNMEELHATQEEMERKRQEQEIIQEQLREDKSILSSLLQNSPDLIYQKDTEGRYVRLSNSMLNIFNIQDIENAIGLTDFDLLSGDQARILASFDNDVMRSKTPIINKMISIILSDNQTHEAVLTLMPLVEDNNILIGVLGIIKIMTNVN
ncbi:MAG: GAF domain-containing protein [Bacteroidales bacterium]